jgi:hypothetical protein
MCTCCLGWNLTPVSDPSQAHEVPRIIFTIWWDLGTTLRSLSEHKTNTQIWEENSIEMYFSNLLHKCVQKLDGHLHQCLK